MTLQQAFEHQKQAFATSDIPTLAQRKNQLDNLKKLMRNHREELAQAVRKDYTCRGFVETEVAECMLPILSINYTKRHLKKWMKKEKCSVHPLFFPLGAHIHYEPKGVVGIIAPWNYPIMLTIMPLIGALAAGNRAMIKMSEYTPTVAETMQKLLAKYFSDDVVKVITGDAKVGEAFSQLPFDHILYTGSTGVGKLVMKAASENLTPVTLELGGKSPAVIGQDANLDDAIERLLYAKFINAGQTCVSVDYLYCHTKDSEAVEKKLIEKSQKMYPQYLNDDNYSAMVSAKHLQRIQDLIEDAKAKGGKVVPVFSGDTTGKQKQALMLVMNPTDDMLVMQEEIFGPILPIKTYQNLSDVIDEINSGHRPLAAYYFDYDKSKQQQFVQKVLAGGIGINECMTQTAIESLPFGGVGHSGMGRYHGIEGFKTFSNPKGVVVKQRFNPAKLFYPPYNVTFLKKMMALVIR